MKHIDVVATLVENRHDRHAVLHLTDAALRDPSLEHSDTVALVTTLMAIIYDAGRRSADVDTVLDLVAAIPDTLAEGGTAFTTFSADDVGDSAKVRGLYLSTITGTVKDDRVWLVQNMPGDLHAVALDGSRVPKRFIAVVGGTQEDAQRLRAALNTLDGR